MIIPLLCATIQLLCATIQGRPQDLSPSDTKFRGGDVDLRATHVLFRCLRYPVAPNA